MKKKFHINPLFYGAILGGISALIGSLLLAATGLMITIGLPLSFEDFVYSISIGLRLFFIFSLIPGIAGGVFLGWFISKNTFSKTQGFLYGMAAGAASVLVAIIIFFMLIGETFLDMYVFGVIVLAMFIAGIMAGLTSLVLMKTKLTHTETPDTL